MKSICHVFPTRSHAAVQPAWVALLSCLLLFALVGEPANKLPLALQTFSATEQDDTGQEEGGPSETSKGLPNTQVLSRSTRKQLLRHFDPTPNIHSLHLHASMFAHAKRPASVDASATTFAKRNGVGSPLRC